MTYYTVLVPGSCLSACWGLNLGAKTGLLLPRSAAGVAGGQAGSASLPPGTASVSPAVVTSVPFSNAQAPGAVSDASSVASGSTERPATAKPTLNPFAKSFSFNPNAQAFVPGVGTHSPWPLSPFQTYVCDCTFAFRPDQTVYLLDITVYQVKTRFGNGCQCWMIFAAFSARPRLLEMPMISTKKHGVQMDLLNTVQTLTGVGLLC